MVIYMSIQEELIKWYQENKRVLPFRDINDPYKIWVSEIMLQQTTVMAVIPYYNRFIERFPDVKTLSDASIEEVYKYWEGLGYYRRALHLHKSAQMIGDQFPKDYEDILALAGVGPYTASAIMSFAYHAPYIAVDGNALRVISRLYGIEDNIALNKTVKKITEIGNKIVIGYDSAMINQGIMDFANAICLPVHPHCEECPLQSDCQAYSTNKQEVLPINIKKVNKKSMSYITGIVVYEDEVMLIKNKNGLLENMYLLPQYEVESPYSFIEAFKEEHGIELEVLSHLKDFKHVFTHRTWYMHVYIFRANKRLNDFYTNKEQEEITIPTAHKKILKYYKD